MSFIPRQKVVTSIGIISALIPVIAVFAILIIGNILLLDYLHVLLGAIWTGVDVFLGVIFRSVFKDLKMETKTLVVYRLMPATLFFIPAVSIVTPLAGYFLAIHEHIWNPGSAIFIWIIIISVFLVAIGFLTIFLSSLLIAHSGIKSDFELSRRFSWICNGALIQLFFQITIMSLMARLVVFN